MRKQGIPVVTRDYRRVTSTDISNRPPSPTARSGLTRRIPGSDVAGTKFGCCLATIHAAKLTTPSFRLGSDRVDHGPPTSHTTLGTSHIPPVPIQAVGQPVRTGVAKRAPIPRPRTRLGRQMDGSATASTLPAPNVLASSSRTFADVQQHMGI